jgi:hypothetical protein
VRPITQKIAKGGARLTTAGHRVSSPPRGELAGAFHTQRPTMASTIAVTISGTTIHTARTRTRTDQRQRSKYTSSLLVPQVRQQSVQPRKWPMPIPQ